MVSKKWVEVNAFVIMSNHIRLIWQIQNGYERNAVQRDIIGEMLGHSNSIVTEHYLDSLDAEMTFAVNEVLF